MVKPGFFSFSLFYPFVLFSKNKRDDARKQYTPSTAAPIGANWSFEQRSRRGRGREKKLFASKLQTEKFNISQCKGALNWWQPPSPPPSCHNHTAHTHTPIHPQNHKPENSFSSSARMGMPRHVSQPLTGSGRSPPTFFLFKFNFETIFIRLLNCL